ncbi:MAG: hypothetical protein A2231_04365 [Candidatus Firestonebacteria bacterium RIFOXYA2_FULL_40_8]|nr:MAG: hypothetical protein A2231_04365 [Candidatus Firestonebacteria bacterium RIFOXYA2_FULL_40_8]
MKEEHPVVKNAIEKKIYNLRGKDVMFSHDLAELYAVETFRLNEAVKRNINRFPDDFMFSLDRAEIMNLSQFAISSKIKHAPNIYAFTEQGIAMLSSVLNSDRAVRINIEIMRYFIYMRNLERNKDDFKKYVESRLKMHDIKFEVIHSLLDSFNKNLNKPVKKTGNIGFKLNKDKFAPAKDNIKEIKSSGKNKNNASKNK